MSARAHKISREQAGGVSAALLAEPGAALFGIKSS
jgi:hypothetical protein